jgi:hypothetical protein
MTYVLVVARKEETRIIIRLETRRFSRSYNND